MPDVNDPNLGHFDIASYSLGVLWLFYLHIVRHYFFQQHWQWWFQMTVTVAAGVVGSERVGFG